MNMKAYVLLLIVSTAFAADDFQKKCNQTKDEGSCRALLPRWWFNATAGECQPFTYGGCFGNENRYLYKERCERTCMGKDTTDPPCPKHAGLKEAQIGLPVNENGPETVSNKNCAQKYETGPCKAKIPMWWFNTQSGKCEQFNYGGCGGNQNRYETKRLCEITCGAKKPIAWPEPLEALSVQPESVVDVCRRPPHTGPCMAYMPRFYYDAQSKQCRAFIYGGCDSNGNNFETMRQCMNACAPPAPWKPEPMPA